MRWEALASAVGTAELPDPVLPTAGRAPPPATAAIESPALDTLLNLLALAFLAWLLWLVMSPIEEEGAA